MLRVICWRTLEDQSFLEGSNCTDSCMSTSMSASIQAASKDLLNSAACGDVEAVRRIIATRDAAATGARAAAAVSATTAAASTTAPTAETTPACTKASTACQAAPAAAEQHLKTLLAASRFDGTTALHLATGAGHEGVVAELLTAGASVNVVDNMGCTPLIKSAGTGRTSVVRQLLLADADVTATDNVLEATALHWAAYGGHTSAVQILLDAGAAVNAGAGSSTGTPLQRAAAKGSTAVITALIAGGADVNAVDSRGFTALHEAVGAGCAHCISLLLKAGAAVNALAPFKLTALHMAGQSACIPALRVLLAAGADVTTGRRGHGAFEDAAAHAARLGSHWPKVLDCFLDHSSSIPTQLIMAAAFGAAGVQDSNDKDAQWSVVRKLLLAAAKQDAAATQAALQRPPVSFCSSRGAWALIAGVLMDMVLEAAAQAVDTNAQHTTMQSMLVCVAGMRQQEQHEEPS